MADKCVIETYATQIRGFEAFSITSHDAVVREKPVDRANQAKSQAALGDTSEPQG